MVAHDPVGLRAGILIAGSLYWNDKPHRQQWRKTRTDFARACGVRVPIRYGRLSSTGSYTMVFAPGSPEGKGLMVPCLQPIATVDDLIDEACHLWLAESRDGGKVSQAFSASWGCVALLAHPDCQAAQGILDGWAERVAVQRHAKTKALHYDSEKFRWEGRAAVTSRGVLDIPWPRRSGDGEALQNVDILLATATCPSNGDGSRAYPDPIAIAGKWKRSGDLNYFRQNRAHGFHTFQDEAIERALLG